ncbi:uncharacterized protein LOC129960290 [Argiope bruennichi]|uniref:uncharacterized protein LOC129960290 n=1 Tax=Argiope bruennichi TaxID=94029 RepID=UPI00249479FE|nr:uncharacterized protein LOC129960290 [Argiope bruennichi]XP_055929574.1 uncharacterized protein LOC129960290 [Argiope bruennichi]XP_055929575.1 uncharacterized protein LOC129960290 [Argiope bruennichi]XP_055929576.1 uncharacterized protein LOC129960290 [Argiope bruennichi]XP_055929577.1 uncharacterized protein LOC129960290 [Argiope bruennichi]XP_055929578.1 uncharacterized protein LOC129960290 [Argiope bruennichi]XP_055929579.1 uncharacterized protein LOC129960290 [Argiope bruennichi]
MEKQHYILNLSLEQITLRKVAVILWSQADILHLIKSFRWQSLICDDTIRVWQNSIESKVKKKASVILLTDTVKEELMDVIKPIGPEILKWRNYHQLLTLDSYFTSNVLHQLCWTSVGTVDYKKTAEKLIRQQRMDIMSSYKLACMYCLDDSIKTIWEKLSETNKRLFYDEETPLRIRQPELVIFWTYFIKGEIAKLDVFINRNRNERERTLYQYAFEHAALSGNKVATEYFYQKLTSEEREVSLLETAESVVNKRCSSVYNALYDFPKENFCSVLCYLLSEMSEEEQIQVFKSNPYGTLFCFIDWPWQDLLMKVAGLLWTFLLDNDYDLIIQILARNRTITGYNYPKLLAGLFLQAPSHCRNYIIGRHQFWLPVVICTNNTEIIKLILRNVDDKDREGFVLCQTGYHLCWKLIEDEKWSLLELFVSECRLSSEATTILKNNFMRYIALYYKEESQLKLRKRMWERFFMLIDKAKVKDGNEGNVEEAEKEEGSVRNRPKRKCKRKNY